ncbi:MAG: hypothetical protein WCE64_08940 [Bacteroidales bacterium]
MKPGIKAVGLTYDNVGHRPMYSLLGRQSPVVGAIRISLMSGRY